MGIEERGKALEEAFFARKNKELLAAVKAELDINSKRDELKNATGISDDGVLDELVRAGLASESIAAVSLAPLVLVAWADGNVSDKERQAVLSGAEQAGVKPESAAGQVIRGWLEEQPGENLMEIWRDYTQAICETLPAGEKVKLGEQLCARCRKVAEAAGGFLGMGSISVEEHAVLDALKSAFA